MLDSTNEITTDSTDKELMDAYESQRSMGNGEAIGEAEWKPEAAAEYEGWTVLRHIYEGTNKPGTPVLAQDQAGNLWIVNDLDGPWAILVKDEN